MTADPHLQHDPRCVSWRSTDPARCSCRDEQGHAPVRPWSEGPWIALDTETTGVDVTSDRIVTATALVFTPGQDLRVHNWLADPGVEIPDGAAAVHGISTEHARTNGRPIADVVAEIRDVLAATWTVDVPLLGYNVSFDLSILDAELRRHHDQPLVLAGPVVDPLVLDRRVDRYRRGSRKLVDVCRHYGVVLTEEDAHTAQGDALAAARVAWKIARAYPNEVGTVALQELHEQQAGWHRDWAENFGAYLTSKGKTDDVQREWPMRAGA